MTIARDNFHRPTAARALAPAERAIALLGSDLTDASLRLHLEGLSGVDAVGLEQRAAGLATRSIKTTLEGLGPRPHHRAHRPDHARGRRHPRQGALARGEGDDARPLRPDDAARRRGLRLRRHGAGCRRGPRRRPRRSRRRPHLGRRRRDRLPERTRLAAGQARRHRRRGRRRRRRDRHGHRPRCVPLRALRPGLRRDRRGQGGVPSRRRQLREPQGDPRDRRAEHLRQRAPRHPGCRSWPAATSSRPRPARWRRPRRCR